MLERQGRQYTLYRVQGENCPGDRAFIFREFKQKMLDPIAAMKHKGILPYFDDEDRSRMFVTLRTLKRHFLDIYQRSVASPSAGGGIGSHTSSSSMIDLLLFHAPKSVETNRTLTIERRARQEQRLLDEFEKNMSLQAEQEDQIRRKQQERDQQNNFQRTGEDGESDSENGGNQQQNLSSQRRGASAIEMVRSASAPPVLPSRMDGGVGGGLGEDLLEEEYDEFRDLVLEEKINLIVYGDWEPRGMPGFPMLRKMMYSL